jgi:hypothetical protein
MAIVDPAFVPLPSPEKAGLPSIFGHMAERKNRGYNRLFEAHA